MGCVGAFGLWFSVFPRVRSLATSPAESGGAEALSLDLRSRGGHSFRDDKHHLRTGHRFRLGWAVSESSMMPILRCSGDGANAARRLVCVDVAQANPP